MSKRGGFKRDGSTHYSGISREQQLIHILSNPESVIRREIGRQIGTSSGSGQGYGSGLDFRHVGGTGTKTDAAAYCLETGSCLYTLSVKNHQSKSGTFDWINTSKGFPELTECAAALAQIKADFVSNTVVDVDKIRAHIDGVFSDILDRIGADSEFLRRILASIYDGNPDGMVVFRVAKEEVPVEIIYFPKSELRVLREAALEYSVAEDVNNTPNRIYYLKHKPGTTSAQIMYRSTSDLSVENEGNSTNLRIRFVLNNGVSAFLGLSTKNKYSVPCIKIQQDGVDALLDGITNKFTEKNM
jgi:hypothetical protein